jgi:hypothetical protein
MFAINLTKTDRQLAEARHGTLRWLYSVLCVYGLLLLTSIVLDIGLLIKTGMHAGLII